MVEAWIWCGQWHVGYVSSLEAIEFLTMNPKLERVKVYQLLVSQTKVGETGANFLKTAVVCKAHLTESCGLMKHKTSNKSAISFYQLE